MISWLQHAKTRLQLFAEHKDTLHPISERNDVGLGNKVKYFFSETICKWGKDLANHVKSTVQSTARLGKGSKKPRLLNAIFKSSLLLWIELGIYIMLYNSTTWLELHYRFIGVLQREEMGKVQVDCFLWVPNFETKRKKTCVVFALTFFLYIFTWGRGHLFMCQNGKALFKQEIRTGLLCVNIVSNQSQAKQHSHGKAKSKLAWSKSSRKDSKTHSPIDWKISELRRIKLLLKTSKWAQLPFQECKCSIEEMT